MSREEPNVRIATKSVTGRRDHNEDSVLHETLSDGRILLAVADGMGGHAAGEVASRLALDVLHEALDEGKDLGEAVELANRQVFRKASSDVGKKGMGTTLVAMLVDGDEYRIANVGDSRAYLLGGDDEVRQLSDDHSYVAEAMKRGQSEEEARESRWKDALTRSIGTDAEVEVDVFGPFTAESGTTVLLCSDGLFKTLRAQELADIYGLASTPDDAAETLVNTAYDSGSDDNITVAVAAFGKETGKTSASTIPLDMEAAEEAVEARRAAAEETPAPAGAVREEPVASRPPAATRMPIGALVAGLLLLAVVAAAFLLLGG